MLIDQLFGEEPRETAAGLLQVYVSRLRKGLEPDRERRQQTGIIVTKAPGYLVRVERDELDLERFERLAEEGRAALLAAIPRQRASALVEALALWRGPALADLRTSPSRARGRKASMSCDWRRTEERIDGRPRARSGRRSRRRDRGVRRRQYPLRERLRGQLMLALYRSGRQAEALEAYQDARSALVDGLGIEPSPALQELERRILRQDPSLGLTPSEALPSPERSILLLPLKSSIRSSPSWPSRAR